MPLFDLSIIRGFAHAFDNSGNEIGLAVELNDSSVSAEVQLRFQDGVLWTPSKEAIKLIASYTDEGSGIRRLVLQSYPSAMHIFLGGQVKVQQIKLIVRFKEEDGKLALAEDDPIAAEGTGFWTHEQTMAWLGLEYRGQKQLPLSIYSVWKEGSAIFGLRQQEGTSVTLKPMNLANTPATPITEFGVLRISKSDLAVEILPREQAFVISIASTVGPASDFEDWLKEQFKMLLGNLGDSAFNELVKKVLPENGFPLRFRRKFKLDTTVPSEIKFGDFLPDADALLAFRLNWGSGGSPNRETSAYDSFLSKIPAWLDIGLGAPSIEWRFKDMIRGTLPQPNLQLEFRDGSLGWSAKQGADLPAIFKQLGALSLKGNFRLNATGIDNFELAFLPTEVFQIDMPPILRFLLSRIEWLGGLVSLPDISELENIVVCSLAEAQWRSLFASVSANAELLKSVLKEATLAVGLERAFTLAFSVADNELLPIVWEVWFGIDEPWGIEGPDPYARMAGLLSAIRRFDADLLGAAVKSMLKVPQLTDLNRLLTHLLEASLSAQQDFLEVWAAFLGTAIGTLDRGIDLAGGVRNFGWFADHLATVLDWHAPDRTLDGFMPLNVSMPEPLSGSPGIGMRKGMLAFCKGMLPCLQAAPELYIGSEMTGSVDALISRLISIPDRPKFTPPLLPSPSQIFDFLYALITICEQSPSKQLMLLETRAFWPIALPILGIAIIRQALPRPGNLFPMAPWKRLVDVPLSDLKDKDGNNLTLELAAPGSVGTDNKKRKYLIFSDSHRDQAADQLELGKFGSIHHFSKNKDLFLAALRYADENGYTVLEAGDCEELWYVRDFEEYRTQGEATGLLGRIMETHIGIYHKLRELHRQGRYYRVIGNHDSDLRNPDVRKQLVDFMQESGGPEFRIWEVLLIPGVNTMNRGLLEEICRIPPFREKDGKETYWRFWVTSRFGLDAADYDVPGEKATMMVMHGHQFDFWNAAQNEFIGRMMSNLGGVPLDGLMDPILALEGITLGGSAMVDFADVAADLPIFDCWLSEKPARRLARRIQDAPSIERTLINGLAFQETIAALVGRFLLRPKPATRGWNLDSRILCIGHTHYPQSQPSFPIGSLFLEKSRAAASLINAVKSFMEPPVSLPGPDILPDPAEVLAWLIEASPADKLASICNLKTLYFNTGTAGGWHEGVVWAIEIGERGQARLVFWTKDHLYYKDLQGGSLTPPQTMPWELDELDETRRNWINSLRPDYGNKMIKYLAEFLNLDLAFEKLFRFFSLDPKLLGNFVIGVTEGAAQTIEIDLSRSEIETPESKAGVKKVEEALVEMFIGSMARADAALGPSPRSFIIRAPLPGGAGSRIAALKSLFEKSAFPELKSAAPMVAMLGTAAGYKFPFFNRAADQGAGVNGPVPPGLPWQALAMLGPFYTSGALDGNISKMKLDASIEADTLILKLSAA